ncbi:MAG TPA: protein kinase [Clostridia bacterium]|nr:protein kinase [Clostridia bacterium]
MTERQNEPTPSSAIVEPDDSLPEFDSTRYPAAFFADYEALACLSNNENAETLLVVNRETGEECLAKCYLGESRVYGITESALLKKFSFPAIPRYLADYENETMLCVVREYIAGLPLNEYAAQAHPSSAQAVSIASQICDILAYLHSLTPPIIHRDIKPQNIIIDADDKAWLIDFGISREYDASAAKDTHYFGTVDFAPPEQYGFSQTDNRTDIFSLGVLIGWLLTGESQPRKAMPKMESPRLQKIVKTCTELTPDRRYSSAVQVKKALQRADGHIHKRVVRVILCVAALFACLCAGYAIGRYTDFTPTLFAPAGVTFEEPLIEQAVRQSLNLSSSTPLSEEDLLSVTELYIFGNVTATNVEAFSTAQQQMVSQDKSIKNGGIRSLDDLVKLKNLRILHVALQDIVDVSPLAKLDSLEIIDLNHNPIENVSPLAELYSLRELGVFDSHVSDFSSLSSCPLLESIDAGKSRITTPRAFAGITGLKSLKIRQTPLTTLDGIAAFSSLERLELSTVRDRNLTPLLSLPQLKEVWLNEELRTEAEQNLKNAIFQITYS